MKSFIAAVKSAPKRVAALAIIAGAIIVPTAMFAWGPSDRVTFTYNNPANYVTFNSMIQDVNSNNNPTHGDERNFVQIKEANASNATYGEKVTLAPGKEYEVYVYYHNNAKSSLNTSGEGIAKNAFMRVQMPATVKDGQEARLTGFVGASNAKHLTANGTDRGNQVWDDVFMKATGGDYALRYVENSATVHSIHNGTKAPVDGMKMADTLYSTGAPLGYNKLDGNLPGCNEYAGYVTFRFKAVQPNFAVEKQVSVAGENKFQEEITVKPGDKVDYKIQYKNTGSTRQDNVVIKDALPKGVEYIAGSTQLANSATEGKWKQQSSDAVVSAGGLNIGSYAADGGNAYLKFSAKVVAEDKLACGVNTLVNKASAETDNGGKSDTATVKVTKTCAEKKVKVCDTTTKQIVEVTDEQSKDNKYTAKISECAEVPTELPETGLNDGLAVLGLGSLVAAGAYYINSRRVLN